MEYIDAKPRVRKPFNNFYGCLDNYSLSARAAARTDNPVNKRPTPSPRYSKKIILTPEGKIVEFWKCACCEVVNEAKRTSCKKCMVVHGSCSFLLWTVQPTTLYTRREIAHYYSLSTVHRKPFYIGKCYLVTLNRER